MSCFLSKHQRFVKALLFTAAALLLLCCALTAAQAEEARDLTADCSFSASTVYYRYSRCYDRDAETCFSTQKDRDSWLEIGAPNGESIHGLYICFGGKLTPWALQVCRDGKWQTVYEDNAAFAHVYVPVDGEAGVRILLTNGKAAQLVISELYAFGEGEVPAFVQRWQPTVEDADLMVLTAHPDDEAIYFGGTIPYYAGERKMQVLVVYMTANYLRRSELLNGLWAMGERNYPVIGDFDDRYCRTLSDGYKYWDGRKKVKEFLIGVIGRYRPEVIVSHDVNGEYGHGAHQVCADALLSVVPGTDVQKLYLHLYAENPIEMDWDQPLSAFGGRTAFEVAKEGFAAHVSQHTGMQYSPDTHQSEYFAVEPRGNTYSSYRFGLAYSAVGPDEAGNDFFEHVR